MSPGSGRCARGRLPRCLSVSSCYIANTQGPDDPKPLLLGAPPGASIRPVGSRLPPLLFQEVTSPLRGPRLSSSGVTVGVPPYTIVRSVVFSPPWIRPCVGRSSRHRFPLVGAPSHAIAGHVASSSPQTRPRSSPQT